LIVQKVYEKIGSNRVLLSQEISFEPKKAWKILFNSPLKNRAEDFSKAPNMFWLRVLDEIRTFFRENPTAEF